MKIKKLNNKGFVLAETLVVTVFLMVIFTMIYSYFYPLIGEYEKRENYDDVDSTYAIYWIKRIVEDSSYKIGSSGKKEYFRDKGFLRVECGDIQDDEQKRDICVKLVTSLQVEGCDENGNYCNIFLTKHRIGGTGASFKDTVRSNPIARDENCVSRISTSCDMAFRDRCYSRYEGRPSDEVRDLCADWFAKKIFRSGLREYILSLPDYQATSINNAKYRIVASFKHTLDNNSYYTYATIEVNK